MFIAMNLLERLENANPSTKIPPLDYSQRLRGFEQLPEFHALPAAAQQRVLKVQSGELLSITLLHDASALRVEHVASGGYQVRYTSVRQGEISERQQSTAKSPARATAWKQWPLWVLTLLLGACIALTAANYFKPSAAPQPPPPPSEAALPQVSSEQVAGLLAEKIWEDQDLQADIKASVTVRLTEALANKVWLQIQQSQPESLKAEQLTAMLNASIAQAAKSQIDWKGVDAALTDRVAKDALTRQNVVEHLLDKSLRDGTLSDFQRAAIRDFLKKQQQP
jgi:hypothetical protein